MHLVNVYSTPGKSSFLSINGKKIVPRRFFKGFKKKYFKSKNSFFILILYQERWGKLKKGREIQDHRRETMVQKLHNKKINNKLKKLVFKKKSKKEKIARLRKNETVFFLFWRGADPFPDLGVNKILDAIKGAHYTHLCPLTGTRSARASMGTHAL